MDRTDRRIAREASRAQRQEMKHDRKEARLHAKAVNAAVHGNIGKAAVLQARAGQQAQRADEARMREQSADAALAARMATRHHQHHYGPPHHVQVVNPPPPPAGYTVTTTTYVSPPHQHIIYPTGQAAPPPAYPGPQYPQAQPVAPPSYPQQYPPQYPHPYS